MIAAWQLPILFVTGVAAGFVDSIAGGGGLITIPVLMNAGLPPVDALGTNKLQATFGSGSASFHYAAGGAVNLRECVLGFAVSCLSAILGASLVRQLDPAFLRRAIPLLLIALAVYFICRPALGQSDLRPRMRPWSFHLLFGSVIGFYDGFFGPGTGTFWTMAYMLALGFNMTRATAHTKVMNFASNLGALALFLAAGNVVFSAGLAMGIGQWFGARLGSGMVLAKGARFIRPIFLTVVFALTAKLVFDAYGP